MASDEHLEKALAEYDRKIEVLEETGTDEEYFEALVNRGTILFLMDSFNSSLNDIEDALYIADKMRSEGNEPDTGSLVKLYEMRGQMCYETDDDSMVADYEEIISRLNDLRTTSRHYDRKSLVGMCIGCGEDLIDRGFSENALPFLEKGLLFVGADYDPWSVNRRVSILNLLGQAHGELGRWEESYKDYTNCIDSASKLYLDEELEDEMELVFAFVNRGDIEEEHGMKEEFLADHKSAIDVLEQLDSENKLESRDLLADLHKGIAKHLMDNGSIETAEMHLLKAMKYEMPPMDKAIRDLDLKKNQ